MARDRQQNMIMACIGQQSKIQLTATYISWAACTLSWLCDINCCSCCRRCMKARNARWIMTHADCWQTSTPSFCLASLPRMLLCTTTRHLTVSIPTNRSFYAHENKTSCWNVNSDKHMRSFTMHNNYRFIHLTYVVWQKHIDKARKARNALSEISIVYHSPNTQVVNILITFFWITVYITDDQII